jgi:hypothetical protein
MLALALQRELVDLRTLVISATETVRRQGSAKNRTLDVRIAETVPSTVHVDPEKLEWAVSNLLRRALRQVTGTGGVVTVEVGYQVDRSLLSITITAGDEPMEKHLDLPRPDRELIVWLVHSIAAAHNGRLEIATNPDPFDPFIRICLSIPDA